MDALESIRGFLRCETPDSWIAAALADQETMLIDHAHCEQKAAATAMSLMYRYPDRTELLIKMARLAREELVHFEQVLHLMTKRGIEFRHLTAARYASGLRDHMSKQEPQRLIDVLIIGAYVEARSCERFARIAPHLDEELGAFYTSLLKSEGRHYLNYLKLARLYAKAPIDERVAYFADIEAELILSGDEQFRFHSGTPIAA
ncbi:tRNA-(ms[2]io[6]A)-hydroxylase [Pokkaliibacter sp. MBI-7]|uniref:tRNA-(Ms[2]io[6]A)-hydroxylase n=1 Tax=Proteobacteria bacterium 228 TaxID=2083153 RepID=A0A2S5KR16_9PROT|nr:MULTISPECIES: tRNA-(ms[2]io[6]A)-hydroxylase [Pokkaliibacter]MDH2435822.1 tRNA-(ms[2]io[6]A)-hydroxylase [Pokkaliibacter sp. MBI-7]PPC77143.1 tRNA-(ms[2]io[6]A)-hydroxylase [Pokkaliibacter plantistimulans]